MISKLINDFLEHRLNKKKHELIQLRWQKERLEQMIAKKREAEG